MQEGADLFLPSWNRVKIGSDQLTVLFTNILTNLNGGILLIQGRVNQL